MAEPVEVELTQDCFLLGLGRRAGERLKLAPGKAFAVIRAGLGRPAPPIPEPQPPEPAEPELAAVEPAEKTVRRSGRPRKIKKDENR